jgi:tight adherence protein B
MDIEDIVKNDVWKEWCEAMILCQHDRTKADMLDPIINKLRNMDSVQTELDAMLYKPIGVFMTMLVLVLINFPILFFLNREWFNILIYSNPGKLAVTITFAVLLYSLFALIRAIRPLEYKR